MEGFIMGSEFELNEKKIPYYGVKLTPEQSKVVKDCEMDFLSIDGKKLFKVKDENGKETGEHMLFILFGTK